jgi:hypothetical protein
VALVLETHLIELRGTSYGVPCPIDLDERLADLAPRKGAGRITLMRKSRE